MTLNYLLQLPFKKWYICIHSVTKTLGRVGGPGVSELRAFY